MIKSAKECIKEQASSSEMYGRMKAVFIEMDTAPPTVSALVMYNHLHSYSLANYSISDSLAGWFSKQRVEGLKGGCNEYRRWR